MPSFWELVFPVSERELVFPHGCHELALYSQLWPHPSSHSGLRDAPCPHLDGSSHPSARLPPSPSLVSLHLREVTPLFKTALSFRTVLCSALVSSTVLSTIKHVTPFSSISCLLSVPTRGPFSLPGKLHEHKDFILFTGVFSMLSTQPRIEKIFVKWINGSQSLPCRVILRAWWSHANKMQHSVKCWGNGSWNYN